MARAEQYAEDATRGLPPGYPPAYSDMPAPGATPPPMAPPSIRAAVAGNVKSLMFNDAGDPRMIDLYFKEFERFKVNVTNTSRSILSNLQEQAKALPGILRQTDERRQGQVISGFLVSLERVHDRYMSIHKVFLFDQGFIKKLQYLWRYAPDRTMKVIDTFLKDTIDPFFEQMGGVTNSVPMSGGASDALLLDLPAIQQTYNDFIERLAGDREKLYDFYYNKATPSMFQWSTTHTLMYSLKALRILFLWITLFLASKTFQAKYVQKVFANNEDPPSLTYFVLLFWVMEAVLMLFIFIILYLLKYLLNTDNNFVVNDAVLGKFIGDYVATTALIVVAGLIIGNIMMKKKYFRYKSDGLRAIRSFQEVMFYISAFIVIFPFFQLF
jgi:phosphatidylglycerophosphatase A